MNNDYRRLSRVSITMYSSYEDSPSGTSFAVSDSTTAIAHDDVEERFDHSMVILSDLADTLITDYSRIQVMLHQVVVVHIMSCCLGLYRVFDS